MSTVVERRATLLTSSFTTIGLCVIAIAFASQTWPYVWLPVELVLVVVRFVVVTQAGNAQGDRFRLFTRLCLATGLAWTLWLGVAIALSLASGDIALSTLAAALAAGVAGGATSRNAGTPVYAAMVIVIILASLVVGLLLSPAASMKIIAFFALPWALTLGVMLTQNHAVLHRLIRAEQIAKHAARTDPLTGVFNRTHLDEVLSRPLATRSGVLCFDLDGFKRINDDFGHPAGDMVLCEVARRARSALRASDILVRMGGDEFAVLLSDADLADCDAVAKRILGAVSAPCTLPDGREIKIGISIGSACAGRRGELPLGAADRALYKAKANGKGGHVHLAAV